MNDTEITLEQWLGDSQLGIDILNKKYLQEGETLDEWGERISGGNKDVKRLFIEKKFIPAGRILSNRGLNNKGIKSTLSNCYVLTVDDSIESIYQCCSDMARTYSYGGGVGIDISKLRPAGAVVHNSARSTSGAVSFMKTFDVVTGTIGQCIDGEAFVCTKDGVKKIKDVEIGDYVYTRKGFIKVVNKINQGVKKTKKVTSEFGYEIVTTEDHPFITCNEVNPLIVKELSQLQNGDNVIIMPGKTLNTDYVMLDINVELPTHKIVNQTGECGETVHNLYMECKLPEYLDEKLGYLLGYMSGDGYTDKTSISVTCNATDTEIISKIKSYVFDVFGVECGLKDYRTYKCLTYGGKQIKLFLELNGIGKPKTDFLRIPESIFNSPSSVQAAYLSGLMDSDGYVSTGRNFYRITTVNHEFAVDIQRLFSIIGITTKIEYYTPKNPNWKTKNNVTIIGKVNKERLRKELTESVKVKNKSVGTGRDGIISPYTSKSIGFQRTKQHNYIPNNGYISINCVQRLINEGIFSEELLIKDTIANIVDNGYREVYDITLEDENMFWCNGFYVHNCGRRGALMISLDVTHPDVAEFVDIKANTDQITNANISVRVNDSFMKAVDTDSDYLLHWPCEMKISDKEIKAVDEYNKLICVETVSGPVYLKKIRAKDLFMKLVKNNWDYGEPGILYWDMIKNWHMMSANKDFEYAGVNPCVIGKTKILTQGGYVEIEKLVGKEVNVWNGYQWSLVTPRMTGENQHTLIIEMSDGGVVQCTDYHKWVLNDGSRVEASKLKIGDSLATWYDSITGKEKNISIKNISDGGVVDKVYCMNEPKNHTFIANGYLTGNCAEEPLPPGAACLLGAMNLYKYVSDSGEFMFDEFRKDVKTATIGLNEIQIEGTELHPLKIQRESAIKYRQIGLGIFDLGGALIKMGVAYGTPESREIAYNIMHEMLIAAFEQSCDLNTTGIEYQDMFESDFYKQQIEPYIGDEYKGRYPLNSQLLTIAPTGTTSTMVNATSGGGEPMFAKVYTRSTKSIGEADYVVYPQAVLDYLGKDFDKNNLNIEYINEHLNKLPDYFVSADTIEPIDRIMMQSALQKNIDASISSTINLPEKATVQDVYDIYFQAWVNGLKGVTVFREGCKRDAILNRTTEKKESEVIFNTVNAPKRPKVLDGDYYQVKVQGKSFIIIVGLMDEKPYEMFVLPCDECQKVKNHRGKITRVKKKVYKFESDTMEIPNIAIEVDNDYDINGEIDKISSIVNEGHKLSKGDVEIIRDSVYNIKEYSEKREYRNVSIHVSGNLRTGMRLEDIIKLEDKCSDSIVSFNKAISRVLSKYMEVNENTGEHCPECGTELVNEGGCCHCPKCGWSHCS